MSIFQNIFEDPDFDNLNNLSRWNGLSRIKEETVAHHSFIVTWFSRILAEEIFQCDYYDKIKLEIVTYAMFHDFDEIFSGDITHNVKYNSFNGEVLRKELDKYVSNMTREKFKEDTLTNEMFNKYLCKSISSYAKKIVKLSDWLSMLFYLKKEISLGNKNLFVQYDYCIEKIKESTIDLENHLQINFKSEIILGTVSLKIVKEILTINFKEYEY